MSKNAEGGRVAVVSGRVEGGREVTGDVDECKVGFTNSRGRRKRLCIDALLTKTLMCSGCLKGATHDVG